MNINSARCVVLGAGGFIGTNLCRRLSSQVSYLRAFGRRQTFPGALSGIDWLNGDFNDPTSLALAVEGCDTVFHLVNNSTPASANADKVADAKSTIISTLHLLEICRSEKVKRIIFVSSGGTVYGNSSEFPLHERAETWPITAYGISKIAVEKYLYLFEYLHNLDYRVLRVSNPYGPYQTGMKNQGVVAAFLRRAILGQPIEIWGDGTVCRDYLFVDDLVEALVLAVEHDGIDKVFNIGSGKPLSLNEIVRLIETVLSTTLNVSYKASRSLDAKINFLDISRAQCGLNWKPTLDFGDGLSLTATWMKANINSI